MDSTNNYAMRLIEEGLAGHGDVIITAQQTAGKGQRGKRWESAPGESLLMSLVVAPDIDLGLQPLFLAAVATAIARLTQSFVPEKAVYIKWPNDILIGDKKAAGVLIENVVRGTAWQWAVVGIGLNMGQRHLDASLPYATSLRIAGGSVLQPEEIAGPMREAILRACTALPGQSTLEVLAAYNTLLYRRGAWQRFRRGGELIEMRIKEMNVRGALIVQTADGIEEHFSHGSVEWVWD